MEEQEQISLKRSLYSYSKGTTKDPIISLCARCPLVEARTIKKASYFRKEAFSTQRRSRTGTSEDIGV